MANKRMIAKMIVDSDAFLDMPQSTQNLYFHLNLRADDDGFIDNPKRIMKIIGSNQNDLEILLAKRYLLKFSNGVIVIKHWKLHNSIQKDRYKPTVYKEQFEELSIKKNGAYTDTKLVQDEAIPSCIQNDTALLTECNIDKIRLDQNREDEIKEPILPVHKLITKSIAYWNTKTNLPRYRFNRANIPSDIFRDISSHLSVFKPEEINKAIDNLSDNYKKEDPSFRVNSFQSFAVKSIDRWIDDVKPWERYQDDSELPDCAPQESTVPGWIKEEGATFE